MTTFITIDLAPMAGNRVKIIVESNATILRVKQLFQLKEGVPPGYVRLRFQDRELGNHENLDVIGIVNNSTVHFGLFLQPYFNQMHHNNQINILPQQ
jgi:hypothetical protein